MKKFLVLGLGMFLVACGQSAMTEEETVPAVEVDMMEEATMPEATMPTEEAAMPAVETPAVTEEAAQ